MMKVLFFVLLLSLALWALWSIRLKRTVSEEEIIQKRRGRELERISKRFRHRK